MRWLSLILGAAAIAAAARIAINRSRESSHALTPPPPPPAPPRPAVTPDPVESVGPAEPIDRAEPVGHAEPIERAEPVEPAEPIEPAEPVERAEPEFEAASAVSPAASTVRETQDDLFAGLREPAPDQAVEREVEAQLAASPLPAEEVSIEVRDHVVQLEGTVPDPEVATLIGDEAAHVDGVQGLDNRLRPERETVVEEPEPTEVRRED
jgi:BON domain